MLRLSKRSQLISFFLRYNVVFPSFVLPKAAQSDVPASAYFDRLNKINDPLYTGDTSPIC